MENIMVSVHSRLSAHLYDSDAVQSVAGARAVLVMRLWLFLVTSYLTHIPMGHPRYAKMMSHSATSTSRGPPTNTHDHKTKRSKFNFMHGYFVIKLQVVNGNADTRCGKRKNGLMMESAGLNYTHTHTHTVAQCNSLQQGSRSSLIVNQELFQCNSCTL